ncbi:protein unc-93 homolog A-like isoform X2 [Dreissena polymorpha]|nr:protein unc-93 homolog A-like isoform X2 [Dreissena polymorpha]
MDHDTRNEKAILESQFGNTGIPLKPMTPKAPPLPMSKLRIMKNVFVVSFGFLCLFTSFQSLSNLQSSLNKEEGLGVGGLSIIYGALVVSCMFVPPVLIARLGCKWTIPIAMLCYVLYMVANFYAIWGTIVPSAIILGLGAAPLWSAKCTYLTQAGVWYAKHTGSSEDDIINRFFGFFFMMFQTSQIWGNLLSSLVFKTEAKNVTVTEDDLKKCGANFFPGADPNNTNLDKPPMEQIYTLCGIYTGCALLAVLVVAVGLDPIKLDKEEPGDRKFSVHLCLETFMHLWRNPLQKLLIVLTMYSGFEQAFMTGDYTKSYVGCALGIENIGFVMICYGVVDAVCSLLFGRLVQFVGHIPFFILAFLLQGGLQITFLVWVPDPSRPVLFYVFAALWGAGDAIIQTQINALYGFLWTKDSEAAFSNYRLWESMGFMIAFALQNILRTDVKIYICMAFLVLGMFQYAIVEVLHRRTLHGQRHNTKL